jgi:hypothetical protein
MPVPEDGQQLADDATTSTAAGVPLQDIQDAMAHADPRTTRRYMAPTSTSTGTPPTRLRRGCAVHPTPDPPSSDGPGQARQLGRATTPHPPASW